MDWIRWAYVGQKVVCIDDDWENIGDPSTVAPALPSLNEICTIKEIMSLENEKIAFELEEYQGFGFEAIGFRPVRPTDTQVAALKTLLNPTKKKVEETV